MSQIKPVSPSDVKALYESGKTIPDEVVVIFNQLIVKKFRGQLAKILVKDVVPLVLEAMPGVTEDQIFENKWLDVEPLFRTYGWKVEFDSPGYCESYDPFYVFSK